MARSDHVLGQIADLLAKRLKPRPDEGEPLTTSTWSRRLTILTSSWKRPTPTRRFGAPGRVPARSARGYAAATRTG
jgi:hypothetical protein